MKTKRIFKIFIVLLLSLALTACSDEKAEKLVGPKEDGWTSVERDSVFVIRGNITPEYETEIILSGYQEEVYRITEEEYDRIKNDYKAEMKPVSMEVGEKVKAGDTLISFHSKSLDEKLDASKTEAALASLAVEHYTNLVNINPKGDYFIDLKKQMNSKHLADMYIQDINNTYANINIKAVSDGKITFIDPAAKDGNPAVGKALMKTETDDGYYVLSETVSENSVEEVFMKRPDFSVGDVFKAKANVNEYEVEVISAEGDDIRFKLIGNEGLFAGETLRLYCPMPELKDVCYVDGRAVINGENGSYVFVLNEDGSRRAVKVRTGSTVGTDIIIEEGLNGGEEVTLP